MASVVNRGRLRMAIEQNVDLRTWLAGAGDHHAIHIIGAIFNMVHRFGALGHGHCRRGCVRGATATTATTGDHRDRASPGCNRAKTAQAQQARHERCHPGRFVRHHRHIRDAIRFAKAHIVERAPFIPAADRAIIRRQHATLTLVDDHLGDLAI